MKYYLIFYAWYGEGNLEYGSDSNVLLYSFDESSGDHLGEINDFIEKRIDRVIIFFSVHKVELTKSQFDEFLGKMEYLHFEPGEA